MNIKEKKINAFGKSIPVIAIVLMVLTAGIAGAALVGFLSNVETKPVNVESPIELSGTITYQTTEYEALDIVAPTINGVIDDGEWDEAVSIDVASDMGTVKVLATTDYLYVLFDVEDSTDARIGQNIHGNDQTSININPTVGAPWGLPCDIIFQIGADPAAWGGTSSGTTDGWETDWKIDGVQQATLPSDLETKTVYDYDAGRRISEWKVPLASIAPSLGDTLKAGGAIDVGDGSSYVYPIGLDWSDASTYVHYTIGKPIVVTEDFDGGLLSVPIYGGSEFFMHFEAKNLANRPIEAPLALVIDGPAGTTWTTDEIKAGEPEPEFDGVSGEYLVGVFAELGTIGPGATHELHMRIQFSEAIQPGDYEFRAVVVWSEIAEDTGAILEAAGIP